MVQKILITGSAGFIGYHLSKRLIELGSNIIGIDNLNSYYDINLKNTRLLKLKELASEKKNFIADFIKVDLIDKNSIDEVFDKYKPEIVIHLAAQAGVRYSLTNPQEYINSNLLGFSNILENLRRNKVKNFIYASSSSVYGGNKKVPFVEKDPVNHPISLYAATKRSNELMAHSYSHLYGIASTALRFFTVYGPWGRPDMAPMIFSKAIFSRKPIDIFNFGNMKRDFTYIDDVISTLLTLINKPATSDTKFNYISPNPSTSWACHRIFNLGSNNPIELNTFIDLLENEIGIKAKRNFIDMQPGDIQETYSDNQLIYDWSGYKERTDIALGIKKFIRWYKDFYKIS